MARPTDVVWDVTGCEETAAIPGDRADSADLDVLVIIVYQCDATVINDRDAGTVAISEISVLHGDGTSTLLRQVTNSSVLYRHLRSLGLRDSFLGTIDYEPGKIRVSFAGKTYSLTGTGSPSPIPPTPSEGGASYTYEGRHGTINIAYDNHEQNVAPSIFTVDASKDPALAEWLGSDSATAPALLIQGAWTGTASLEAK